MSDTILNMWTSGKMESRSLVALLGTTDLFTAGLAISTWVASGQTFIPGAARFYLVWTSFLAIAAAVSLTAFVLHLPLRNELVFGAVLTAAAFTGQVMLTWAVQYGGALPAAFTAVSVFASLLVVTLHGSAAVLWYSRQNLLPTVFKEQKQAPVLPPSPA